jgi:hypothetical protein
MRELSWKCKCGAEWVLRYPSHAHLTSQKVVCTCGESREQMLGSPLEFFKRDEDDQAEQGSWVLPETHGR